MVKRALITGASSGIGKGTAIRLAREGWHVMAQGRREDALADTLKAIGDNGGSGKTLGAEMADMDQVAELAAWASKDGALDAVVHCAAKFTYGAVSPERFSDWDLTIDRVLRATIRLTASTLDAVKAAQGSYVFICGPTSWLGWKNHAIHCAVRHAQAGFAKALFEDVREDGVGVCLVHPGFVNTPAVSGDKLDHQKMIQVEDIAEAIVSAITLPNTACITEMTLRPQRSPYA